MGESQSHTGGAVYSAVYLVTRRCYCSQSLTLLFALLLTVGVLRLETVTGTLFLHRVGRTIGSSVWVESIPLIKARLEDIHVRYRYERAQSIESGMESK